MDARTCKTCGNDFTPDNGMQFYCRGCRPGGLPPAEPAVERTCRRGDCGKTFTTTRSFQVYCSDACRDAENYDRRAARPWPKKPPRPKPADPGPWTMVEAVFYAAQLADLRRERDAASIAAELTQQNLDALLATCRAALDRETESRKRAAPCAGSSPANSAAS